ncbi:MAG: four helix bundle protein [Bacteroidetes bacterium]|nr:four helix bundle protein [Bacteroidota bacterium]
MDIDDLLVYKLSMALAEKIWNIVQKWNIFERNTVGRQWVDAADSIGANISEGYGRYYYKDSKLFLYYSRGSLSETTTWLKKASNRNLITEEEFIQLSAETKDLWIRLNNYINSIGKK